MAKRKAKSRITRDIVLFVFGLGGIVHETVRIHADRPYLLLLFGYMTGLPIVSPIFENLKLKIGNGNGSEDTASES